MAHAEISEDEAKNDVASYFLFNVLGRPNGEEMLFKYHQAKYEKDASRFFSVKLVEDQCWLPNEI